jgi:hypothetical protein
MTPPAIYSSRICRNTQPEGVPATRQRGLLRRAYLLVIDYDSTAPCFRVSSTILRQILEGNAEPPVAAANRERLAGRASPGRNARGGEEER